MPLPMKNSFGLNHIGLQYQIERSYWLHSIHKRHVGITQWFSPMRRMKLISICELRAWGWKYVVFVQRRGWIVINGGWATKQFQVRHHALRFGWNLGLVWWGSFMKCITSYLNEMHPHVGVITNFLVDFSSS